MVQNYKRKTDRQNWDVNKMQMAIEAVNGGMDVRTASRQFEVPRMALKRRVQNKNSIATDANKSLGSKQCVFTPDQEQELVNHILNMESRLYGLTTRDVRCVAYQLAEKNNIKHPFSHEEQAAGKDWLVGFRKRHPEISLRNPEPTSAARARAFNKPVVTRFFSLLNELTGEGKFKAHRIFNVDETSISTVPGKCSKVIAKKGRKQVGRVTSAERGDSTTAVICMSGIGNFIPPMLIFSRQRMKQELMDGAPAGAIAACNETGWMRQQVFSQWFDHFLLHTKPSEVDPALLVLDGHLSHTKNLEVIEKARANHVTIFCLPPHCTHRLQPLDVGVMFPLKTYHDQALQKWMNNHHGRVVTVFQISKIFCESYLKACTPLNAISGFRKTGIIPFNPDVFTDADFVAAETTDQADGDDNINVEPENSGTKDDIATPTPPSNNHILPSTSQTNPTKPDSSPRASTSFSHGPEEISPLPKLTEKRSMRKRKSTGNVVLTSSPYKNELSDEQNRKTRQAERKEEKRNNAKKPKLGAKQARKSLSYDEEENGDENDAVCIFCSETFSSSNSGEGWIRCCKCLKWAHDNCAGVDETHVDYRCDYCA